MWLRMQQCVTTQEQFIPTVTLLLLLISFLLFLDPILSYPYNYCTFVTWPPGAAQQVFVPGSDASNFFKRRTRRSGRYYAELLGTTCLFMFHCTIFYTYVTFWYCWHLIAQVVNRPDAFIVIPVYLWSPNCSYQTLFLHKTLWERSWHTNTKFSAASMSSIMLIMI